MPASALRDRTRLAVQTEVAELALELFAERGFEATTVEVIAERAGMSRRSFFRYFSSKEDLVAQKYGLWSTELGAALRARPAAEPPWDALRRAFDTIVDYYADEDRRERVLALQDVVDRSAALLATTLAVFHDLQRLLGEVLVERTARTTSPLEPARAIAFATAAWAAVQAALTLTSPDRLDELGATLDQTMDLMRPHGL